MIIKASGYNRITSKALKSLHLKLLCCHIDHVFTIEFVLSNHSFLVNDLLMSIFVPLSASSLFSGLKVTLSSILVPASSMGPSTIVQR